MVIAGAAGAGLLLLLSLFLRLSGVAPGDALMALVRGSVGSADAFLSATLVRAIPLLLTGLGVALAFQAGVLNIGAEGQLLAGAAAGTAVALSLPGARWAVLPLVLLAAAGAGAAWALVPALLRRRYAAPEVITTIMLNFLALHLVSYLVRGPMQEPTRIYPQSPSLPHAARLPLFADSRLHAGIAIALVLAVGLWLVLHRTAAGFRVRAIGHNARAAASAGRIDVARLAVRAFLWSAALAGLAGGVEVAGVTYALYENLSPGFGYTAIGVALLAGLNPILVVPSAVFFGALEAGAAAMQRSAGVPAGFVSAIEAALVLVVLAVREAGARSLASSTGRRESE